MKIYMVLHCHRHGVSRYLLKAVREPTKSEVIAFLDIDYEPDREESIEIECAGTSDDIPVLPNRNKEK